MKSNQKVYQWYYYTMLFFKIGKFFFLINKILKIILTNLVIYVFKYPIKIFFFFFFFLDLHTSPSTVLFFFQRFL